ncbi:polysaccharide pyruvyl transferase family protein [Rhodococcoides fascians]|uniref:polysaccharide pyruvyl transferase family protein n=1 Tax=Rhodococcoides fascians TaxID=1828 RepID=UPI00211B1700|nr:polysaccharide pyruvyl transferase family protein [Rhodococcus fascians]
MLVCWADDISTNLGVRALASGAKCFVQQAFPEAEIDFQSFGSGSSPLDITERSMLKAAVNRSSEISKWISEYDLVLDMRAGDSFADIYGIRRVISMSLLTEIAHRKKVPVVLGPQTIGPFTSRMGKALARRALNKADQVFARDSVSAEYAKGIGRQVDSRMTDVVFCIPAPEPAVSRDIGLNVSGLLWESNPHVSNLEYRNHLEQLCSRLLGEGRSITLFPHVLNSTDPDNDLPAVEALQRIFGQDVDIYIPTGLEDVRSLVSSCDVVIGSRMHACLNAISVGTPAISLSYSRKFEPLLSDLGWNYNIDLKTSEDPVGSVIRLLGSDSMRPDLERTLDRARTLINSGVRTLQSRSVK